VLENKWVRCSLLNAPFLVLYVGMYIYSNLNLELFGLYEEGFDFSNVLLFCNTIELVLIASAAYAYKEVLLNIIDEKEFLDKIKNIICKIKLAVMDDKRVIVESETFGNKSIQDYNILLSHSNSTFRIMHRNIYSLEFMLIFLAVIITVFDFVFIKSFPSWKFWRFFYMFGVNFLIILSIIVHGFLVLLQYKLKENIRSSATGNNIEEAWMKYLEDSKLIGQAGSIDKELEEFKESLGL